MEKFNSKKEMTSKNSEHANVIKLWNWKCSLADAIYSVRIGIGWDPEEAVALKISEKEKALEERTNDIKAINKRYDFLAKRRKLWRTIGKWLTPHRWKKLKM